MKAKANIAVLPGRPSHSNVDTISELRGVGLLELLETDERPILIFDLNSLTKNVPVYYNAPLQELRIARLGYGLEGFESTVEAAKDWKHSEFTQWAVTVSVDEDIPAAIYCGIRWRRQTLRKRWRVISGERRSQDVDSSKTQRPERSKLGRSQPAAPVKPRLVSHDGTSHQAPLKEQFEPFALHYADSTSMFPAAPVTNTTTKKWTNGSADSPLVESNDILSGNSLIQNRPHVKFFLEFDWASTALGPIESWSMELHLMCNFLLADPRPAAMYWGEQRTMMYNQHYVIATGQNQPLMMGKSFLESRAEVGDKLQAAFRNGYETGIATTMDAALFYLERDGFLEETYYSMSMIPFSTSDGHMAFYNPVFDTTRQVIADRRMAFLLRLGQFVASSREPKDFWQQLLRGLQPNHPDLPSAVLYSVGGDINNSLSISSEQSQYLKVWTHEGLGGAPRDAPNIPTHLSTEQDLDEFLPNFLDLIRKNSPSVLLARDGSLPPGLIRALQGTDAPESCETAVFLPIRPTGEDALGFLIVGINPQKRYDDDYQLFIELLSRQLDTSIAAAVLFEEEMRRAHIAAEQETFDRNLLSRKLAIQTPETSEIESRFRRMADMAPVGLFHIDPDGSLVYANEYWFGLTQRERDILLYPKSWYDAIMESDHALMDSQWLKLMRGEPVTFELRLRKPFEADEIINGEKVTGPTWIIVAAYPEKGEDGTVVGVLGCLTDISRQKWAEGFQERKMLEAIELKRQQENFIDITSHEIRNPLSAIIQCADMICSSLVEFDSGLQELVIPREIIDSHEDAAQTIIMCAQHQKRIIDDILTLSKLDSDLLLITPVEVQPISVVQKALKIFDGELQKCDIELRFVVEPSYTDLAVDWVKLDPSRMLQVFINLVTNAIKFTQPEQKRKIAIRIGASLDHPSVRNGIEYLPRNANYKDMTVGPDWGDGEPVYVYVEVQDSGRGMTEEERNMLFRRFAQASPRTHVQYGGSGLGLFISRELTEMQGGQIGVASEAGVGSTFAFYLRARRCLPPEDIGSGEADALDINAQSKLISTAALARVDDGSSPARVSEKNTPLPLDAAKHILIVEDNIVNQRVLSKQLRNAGCIVSVANHGGEALAFLEKSRFWKGNEDNGKELSLVLMDLEMPVMDGLTCVKRIRQLEEEGKIVGHVPVIAVTANARSEQIATAKDSGMDSVVTKPFRIPQLMPEMDKQLRKGIERPTEEDRDRPVSAPP